MNLEKLKAVLAEPLYAPLIAAAKKAVTSIPVRDADHQAELVAAFDAIAKLVNEQTVASIAPLPASAIISLAARRALITLDTDQKLICSHVIEMIKADNSVGYDLTNNLDKELVDSIISQLNSAGVSKEITDNLINQTEVKVKAWTKFDAHQPIDFGDVLIALRYRWEDLTAPSIEPEQPNWTEADWAYHEAQKAKKAKEAGDAP